MNTEKWGEWERTNEPAAWELLRLSYDIGTIDAEFLTGSGMTPDFIGTALEYWKDRGYVARTSGKSGWRLVCPREAFFAIYALSNRIEPAEKPAAIDPEAEREKNTWEALRLCYKAGEVSCSYLQRRMNKGYNYVSALVDALEAEGYVSAQDKVTKKRRLILSKEKFDTIYAEKFGGRSEEE